MPMAVKMFIEYREAKQMKQNNLHVVQLVRRNYSLS